MIGDLIVPASSFKNPEDAATYNTQKRVDLFKKGTRLMAQISMKSIPEDLMQFFVQTRSIGPADGCVELVVLGDLSMLERGAMEAELEPCRCAIPALKTEAISVNHAYTLISEKFEPHRKSHTGNVFSKVFYRGNNCWRHLQGKRISEVAD